MSETQIVPREYIEAKDEEETGCSDSVGYIVVDQKYHEVRKGCNKIGRDSKMCNIVLSSNTVSKLHCVIESEGANETYIYDAGSTNQTKLGKKYIKPNCRYKLDNESIITVGSVVVKFLTFFQKLEKQVIEGIGLKNIISFNSGATPTNFENIFDLNTQVNKTQYKNSFNEIYINSIKESSSQKGTINKPFDCNVTIGLKLPDNHNQSLPQSNLQTTLIEPYLELFTFENSSIFNIETQCQWQSNNTKNNINVQNFNYQDCFNNKDNDAKIIPSIIQVCSGNTGMKHLSFLIEQSTCNMGNSHFQGSSRLISNNLFSDTGIEDEKDKEKYKKLMQSFDGCELSLNHTDTKNLLLLCGNKEHGDKLHLIKKCTVHIDENLKNKYIELKNVSANSVLGNHCVKNIDNKPMKLISNIYSSDAAKKAGEEIVGGINTIIKEDKIVQDVDNMTIKNCEKHNTITPSLGDKNNISLDSLDSDSYLEITIDESVHKKINNNSQKEKINDDENYVVQSTSNNDFKFLEYSINSEKRSNSFKSSQFINFAQIKETPHNSQYKVVNEEICSNTNNKHKVLQAHELPLRQIGVSEGASNSILNSSFEGLINARKYDVCAPNTRKGNSSNDTSTVISSCDSFVSETSDESDMEIIEETPNIRPLKSKKCPRTLAGDKNNAYNECTVNRFIFDGTNQFKGNFKECEKIDKRVDRLTGDSYVFGMDEEASCRSGEKCAVSSDSDSDFDIIEMTPPKNKYSTIMFNKKTSFCHTQLNQMSSEELKIKKKLQENPVNLRYEDELISTDSLSSIELPAPEILKETLTKLLDKGNKSQNNLSTGSNSGTVVVSSEISQYCTEKKLKDSKMESDIFYGKRNRYVENGQRVSFKKMKGNQALHDFEKNILHKEKKYGDRLIISNCFDSMEKIKTQTEIPRVHKSSMLKISSYAAPSRYKSLENATKTCQETHVISSYSETRGIEMFNANASTKNTDHRNDMNRNSMAALDGVRKSLTAEDGASDLKFSLDVLNTGDDLNYFGNSCVHVVFTGIDSIALDKIINELGGKKTNDLRSGHVLVTDYVRRTIKFLCAIGLCLPITSPQWLLKSKEKNTFLNPWNYILKSEKWDFDLRDALDRAKKKKLLEGYNIFATESVKPPMEDILCIAECCGGVPVRQRPEKWPRKTIVVSCVEDKKSWPPWHLKYIKIVHYEFILSGVLQQKLDFKTYKLRQ